jgi:hypothetical protein
MQFELTILTKNLVSNPSAGGERHDLITTLLLRVGINTIRRALIAALFLLAVTLALCQSSKSHVGEQRWHSPQWIVVPTWISRGGCQTEHTLQERIEVHES